MQFLYAKLDHTAVCEWYARCGRVAAWVIPHPVLGEVPACQRCADRHDLTSRPGARKIEAGQ